jgi:hypothetical protein
MSTTASKLRHTLAVKAKSEIKKAKHNRSKRPFSEILLAADAFTAHELMAPFAPTSATTRMTKWNLDPEDVDHLLPECKPCKTCAKRPRRMCQTPAHEHAPNVNPASWGGRSCCSQCHRSLKAFLSTARSIAWQDSAPTSHLNSAARLWRASRSSTSRRKAPSPSRSARTCQAAIERPLW